MMWNMVAKFPNAVNPDCPILITRTVAPVAEDKATTPLVIPEMEDVLVKVSMKMVEEIVTRRVNRCMYSSGSRWKAKKVFSLTTLKQNIFPMRWPMK